MSVALCVGCNSKTESAIQSNEANNSDSLTITKPHDVINNVRIYGFHGNRQILLFQDSSLETNQFTFNLSGFDSPAVYRIDLDHEVFDIIYNNESVHVELTKDKGYEGINFIKSEENKHFYAFLKDFAFIQSSEKTEICSKVELLKNKYFDSDNIRYSDLLIKFLVHSTYNCEKMSSTGFIRRLAVKPSLLKTPYVNGQFEMIVNSFAGKNIDAVELLELFKVNSEKNKAFDHFIRSTYWSLGVNNNNYELISALFHPQPIDTLELQKMLKVENFTDVGDQMDLIDFGIEQHSDATQHFLLFSDFTNPTHDSLVKSISNDIKSQENLKLTVLDFSKINDNIKRKYTLISAPIVLHVSSKGYLIDRYVGYKDFILK
jgi:hypothetical protein